MNIFVGNLAFTTTEQDLRQLFEPYGTVDTIRIMTDRETGRSRGFGFVEMGSAEEAEQAISKFNGQEVDGRRLQVEKAKEGGSGGGGARRGGGGFGGGGGRGGYGGGGGGSRRW